MDTAMTQTPTPAEIETLREAVDAFEPISRTGEVLQSKALTILDRLSPAPEPDVDEAMLWARKAIDAYYNCKHDHKDVALNDARTVIAELIASKDAEIGRLCDDVKKYQLMVIDWQNKAADAQTKRGDTLDELAALRAENERKPLIMKADRKVDARALRTLADYIESDTHLKPGNKISWSDCLEGIRRHYLQAAERNTAEPKCPTCDYVVNTLCSDGFHAPGGKTYWPATHDDACSEMEGTETLVPLGPGEPKIGGWTSGAKYFGAEYGRVHTDGSRSGGRPPGTNAGAVEVTEADRQIETGRFRHHPDPVIDFEIEVEEIESILIDCELGLRDWKTERLDERSSKAFDFIPVGVEASKTKNALREMYPRLRAVIGADPKSYGTPTGASKTDEAIVRQLDILQWTVCDGRINPAAVSVISGHRTEAEARGRREALKDIELIPQRIKSWIGATEQQQNALNYCEAELRSYKRIMESKP